MCLCIFMILPNYEKTIPLGLTLIAVVSHVSGPTFALPIHWITCLGPSRVALTQVRTIQAPSPFRAALGTTGSGPTLPTEALARDVVTVCIVQAVTRGTATRSPRAVVALDVAPRSLPTGAARALTGHRIALGPVLTLTLLRAVRSEKPMRTGLLTPDAHPACNTKTRAVDSQNITWTHMEDHYKKSVYKNLWKILSRCNDNIVKSNLLEWFSEQRYLAFRILENFWKFDCTTSILAFQKACQMHCIRDNESDWYWLIFCI